MARSLAINLQEMLGSGGCTDPNAVNFDCDAAWDDETCIPRIPGCMDSTAQNFEPEATIDNGNCLYGIPGCTDPTALNYNPIATIPANAPQANLATMDLTPTMQIMSNYGCIYCPTMFASGAVGQLDGTLFLRGRYYVCTGFSRFCYTRS